MGYEGLSPEGLRFCEGNWDRNDYELVRFAGAPPRLQPTPDLLHRTLAELEAECGTSLVSEVIEFE
jgi:hypothetical protein